MRFGNCLTGMVVLQVDDRLIVGTKEFLNNEGAESKKFIGNSRSSVDRTISLSNGLDIFLKDNPRISITQQKKIESLTILRTGKSFKKQHALAQYFGVTCRLNVCAAVQLIAPTNQPIAKESIHNAGKIN